MATVGLEHGHTVVGCPLLLFVEDVAAVLLAGRKSGRIDHRNSIDGPFGIARGIVLLLGGFKYDSDDL